jgi:hypothetical protein
MMRDLQRLGGFFFFFDRDIPERNAAMLIRKLAYQLALLDSRIGDITDCGKESTYRRNAPGFSDYQPFISEGHAIGWMVWGTNCPCY